MHFQIGVLVSEIALFLSTSEMDYEFMAHLSACSISILGLCCLCAAF